MKKLTLTLLVFALLLSACTLGGAAAQAEGTPPAAAGAPQTVTAEGTLLPAQAVELAFAQGGVVAAVYAQPGDSLAGGDTLARLVGSEIAQAELAGAQFEHLLAEQSLAALKRNALLTSAQAESGLLAAQNAYEKQANGWRIPNPDEASDLELNLEDYLSAEKEYRAARDHLNGLLSKDPANRERKDAQADFDREARSLGEVYAELLQSLAENKQPLTQEQAGLLGAIADLEVARQAQGRRDGHNLDAEKLAAAEARLAAAAAHVAAARAALELYELRAPFGGVLFSQSLAVGETALPGMPVAFLAGGGSWTVETKDLAEIDIARVALGQSALVKLDAFPGEEFPGTVTAIDPVGKEYLGDMTYTVTITLDKADSRFLWNMTAVVTIAVE